MSQSWNTEWYHLADAECLTSGKVPAFLEKLLSINSNTELKDILSDGQKLMDAIKPVAEEIAGKNTCIHPENRRAWNYTSNKPSVEIRETSWPDDSWPQKAAKNRPHSILTPNVFYLPWPFAYGAQDDLRERWNMRIAQLDLTVDKYIGKPDADILSSFVFRKLDDFLDEEPFQEDVWRHRNLPAQQQHIEIEKVVRNRHGSVLSPGLKRYKAGKNNDTKIPRITSMISSDGTQISFTIGTKVYDKSHDDEDISFLVPQWSCGRLEIGC